MNFRFFNAKILTDNLVIDGEVWVRDDKICYVGPNKKPDMVFDREIDADNNLIMPGFVNAHAHTPSTVLRGICDDKPLNDWLNTIIECEQKLTEQDAYYSTMLGIMEYVRAGITTVEECYGHLEQVVKAYQTSGLKARISIGFPNVGKTEKLSLQKQYEMVKNAGLSAVCYGHSIYGTNEENFAELNTFARENNLPVSTHLSETLKEVGDCSAKFDLSPPELLEDYGFFDRKATVYHCVHADKDDLSLMAGYDVNIVTCPSSNLKLASGIAPLYAMQNSNLNIAIGTDGAYSNNSYDMFKEMFLAATLNKATLNYAHILTAEEVVNMATKNGAKALGFNSGEIKQGFDADIIIVSLKGVHHQPLNNIISNIVYSAKSSDVLLTMVNGKILYENGNYYIGEDTNKIYEEVYKIKHKLGL